MSVVVQRDSIVAKGDHSIGKSYTVYENSDKKLQKSK